MVGTWTGGQPARQTPPRLSSIDRCLYIWFVIQSSIDNRIGTPAGVKRERVRGSGLGSYLDCNRIELMIMMRGQISFHRLNNVVGSDPDSVLGTTAPYHTRKEEGCHQLRGPDQPTNQPSLYDMYHMQQQQQPPTIEMYVTPLDTTISRLCSGDL